MFSPYQDLNFFILLLEQGDCSLEEYTELFLHLANDSRYPDSFLCGIYFRRLNISSQAQLYGSGPRESIAAHVEWVLVSSLSLERCSRRTSDNQGAEGVGRAGLVVRGQKESRQDVSVEQRVLVAVLTSSKENRLGGGSDSDTAEERQVDESVRGDVLGRGHHLCCKRCRWIIVESVLEHSRLRCCSSDLSVWRLCFGLLSAGCRKREDTLELHSLVSELEAVEKQIGVLQVKQAQLRKRIALLETSRSEARASEVSPRRDTNTTPITSTPCVSLSRLTATRSQTARVSFTPMPGHRDPSWLQPRRPRARASPPPAFEISTQNRFATLCEKDPEAVIIGAGDRDRAHRRCGRARGGERHPAAAI
ncbi:uncharacterized protein LOC122334170 [Puntigrus tetrazona]|uniref:uncharacterized protein LOC122334170 n=1 Tax=Puntigrus tetrazona TaxID=1606681 RepID=UPI001C88F54A|nr:uncharacterized protein LOC122334170 [Puntigrus tetrazona]